MGKLRVLIVDAPAMRHFLRLCLGEFGEPDFDETDDGIDALRLANAKPYDLIVLDANLPGIDGFELLAKLRSQASTMDTPVILVAINCSPEVKKKAAKLRARLEPKPVQAFALRDLARELLVVPGALEQPSTERRRAPRLRAKVDVRFKGDEVAWELNSSDISSTGAFLVSNEFRPVGTHATVRIRILHLIDPIEIDCEVVHNRTERQGALTRGFGVRFLPATEEKRRLIEAAFSL